MQQSKAWDPTNGHVLMNHDIKESCNAVSSDIVLQTCRIQATAQYSLAHVVWHTSQQAC